MTDLQKLDGLFRQKVNAITPHGPNGDCWAWTGAMGTTGYPKYRGTSASHTALLLDGRPRHDALHALHSCDNKTCVNPAHLRWGTVEENAKDHRERHPIAAAWLTDRQVEAVRASSDPGHILARKYGVSQSCILNIRKGIFRRNEA